MITRSDWNARSPRNRTYVSADERTEFIVHHSAGPKDQSTRSIQDFHMDERGWADIGYNGLVDYLGNIIEGRGFDVQGAHALNHNRSGYGVCFKGQTGDLTSEAKRAIRDLYDMACAYYGRELAVRCHKDVNATDCPHDELYDWVHAGMAVDGEDGGIDFTVVGSGIEPPYAFPLPANHWFGEESPDERNHSGYWINDRPHIAAYQQRLQDRGWNITVSGRHDSQTTETIEAFQRQATYEGVPIGPTDGLVGELTWPWIWRKDVTSYD